MKTIKRPARPKPTPVDPGLLYLDDERPAPPGWKRVYTAREAIDAIERGGVREISLDHDLGETGPDAKTGYDVVLWLEARVHNDAQFLPPAVYIHAANPVGRRKMRAGLAAMHRILAARHGAPTPATLMMVANAVRAWGRP